MRVPFEPTAFPSADRTYLTYELYLTNFASSPVALRRVEILDADTVAAEPIAAFEGGQLNTRLHRIGDEIIGGRIPTAEDSSRSEIAAGASVVVFLSIAIERGANIPAKVRHRVITADSTVEGANIGTHHAKLRVLGPPVQGANWLASSGPSNDSHHRRGILVYGGRAVISRRYAIDWVQTENGATFSGDALDNRSYHSYDEPVLAVADATVLTVRDGVPQNLPHRQPVITPITMETSAGNFIALDLGGAQFAYYLHLQPGTFRVKPGDRVRRGQLLARIGISGDAREAHLHFEVTTSPKLLAGEGVPYLIDHYRTKSEDGAWQLHRRELPLRDMLIDFDQTRRNLH
jgi:hypothetical protein